MNFGEYYNQLFWRLRELGVASRGAFEYVVDKVIMHFLISQPLETRLTAVDEALATLEKLSSDLRQHRKDLEKELSE